MGNRRMVATLGIIGVSTAVGYVIGNKRMRQKVVQAFQSMVDGKFLDYPSPIDAAGIPDQVSKDDLEQLQNTKMVSEGSQYGINYYNEVNDDS